MHNGGGYFDDRAGVLGIIALVNEGCHPYIILTGEEECGCRGALKLVEDHTSLDDLFGCDNYIQCLIELDRQGVLEAVFYDLDYPEFEKIFTRHFDKKQGSYTDIVVLGPAWEIAAVNLSVGYYCEHTPDEFFLIDDFCLNINKTYEIICEFNSYYKEDRWEYRGTNMRYVLLTNRKKYDNHITYAPSYQYMYDEGYPCYYSDKSKLYYGYEEEDDEEQIPFVQNEDNPIEEEKNEQ